jgi:WD40 repeat protein
MILKLEANDHQLQYLSGLITKINHELRIEGFYRRESDSYRRISSLVHDNIQSVDANELSKRLNIRLEESKATHREARNEHQEIEIMIRNLKDELEDVRKEHELETCQLATKNLLNHRIRLMVFNSLLESGDSTGENVDNVSTLVAITVGKDIFIYDSSTGDPTQVFEGDALYGESSRMKGHSSIITSIFFQGKIVFSGAMDAKLCAWDVLSGKLLYVANGHDSTVTCIVCDTGGIDNIISGSVDKTLIVWRKYDGVQLHRLSGHSRGILSLDEAYGTIVSGDADGEIFLWDTKQVSNYIAMISRQAEVF